MSDLKNMMPHGKSDSKMQKKESLFAVNEIAEMKNCSKSLLFEGRKKKDVYMWAANVARGPSVKFEVENIHTMSELKMTGKFRLMLLSISKKKFSTKTLNRIICFRMTLSTSNHKRFGALVNYSFITLTKKYYFKRKLFGCFKTSTLIFSIILRGHTLDTHEGAFSQHLWNSKPTS